jgi:hypothetical protein
MKHLRVAATAVAAVAVCFYLVSSKKQVNWEEEILLNTGEVLLVSRTDDYRRASEPGNPLRTSWWIVSRRYEFTWAGKKIRYERTAKESLGAFMLYVNPDSREISIIDGARACARPGYAEFRWNGEAWAIKRTISPNVIGLKRNLLGHFSGIDGDIPARVDASFIEHSHLDLNQRRDETAKLTEPETALNCF